MRSQRIFIQVSPHNIYITKKKLANFTVKKLAVATLIKVHIRSTHTMAQNN